MVLETEELILRSPELRDARRILDFEIRNRSFFDRWMPRRDEEFFTLQGQRNLIEADLKEMETGRKISLWLYPKEEAPESSICLAESPAPLGSIVFSNIVRGAFLSCFLGYRLDNEHTRRGLMRQALSRAVRFIFEDVGLHRIEANIMPENSASRRLAEACGFSYEGSSPEYLKIRGVWEEHMHYVLLNHRLELS